MNEGHYMLLGLIAASWAVIFLANITYTKE